MSSSKVRERPVEDDEEDEDLQHETPDEPECGIIERVTLSNFRVHGSLTMDLNQNVNFIVGDNGSGKSSVLSGIVMALGGKVKATGQGSNNADVVKYGQSQAKVTVKLRNTGQDAFMQDKFGDSIIVEKTIKRTGGASVVMKDEHGTVVKGCKANEVREMVEHFNIQVENPVMIMTQERQKSFITAKPKDLFEFFNEATQLKYLEGHYDDVTQNLQTTQEQYDAMEATALPQAEQQAKEAKAAWDECKGHQKTIEEIKTLKCQYAWKMTEDEEIKRDDLRIKVSKLASRVEDYKEKLAKAEAEKATAEQRQAALREQLKEIEKEQDASYDAIKALEPEKMRLKKEISSTSAEEKAVKKKIKHCENTVQGKHKQIQNLRTEMSRDMNAEDRGRQEQLQKLLNERDERREAHKMAKHSYGTAFEDHKNAEDRLTDLKTQQEGMDRHLHMLKQSENQIIRVQKNAVSKYHDNMPQLLSAIAKEKKWETKPFGPLGMHIKCNDNKWNMAMESALKGQLGSFLVASHKDRRLLEAKRYKTSPIQCDSPTIQDMLTVEEDQVFNALVDQAGIDVAVLAPNSDKAFALLRDPRFKIRMAYLPDGSQCQARDGSVATNMFRPPRILRMGESDVSNLEKLRAETATVMQQKAQLKSDIAESEQAKKHKRKEIETSKKDEAKLKAFLKQLNDHITKLQDELKEQTPPSDLGEEVEELEKEIDEEKASVANLEETLQEASQKHEEALQAMKVHQQKMDEVTPADLDNSDLQDELKKAQQAVRAARLDLQEQQDRKEAFQTNLSDKTSVLEDQEKTVLEGAETAAKFCKQMHMTDFISRPENLYSLPKAAQIWNKVLLLEDRAKRHQRTSGEDIAVIESRYRSKLSNLESLKKQKEEQATQIEKMHETLELRLEKQVELQRKTYKKLRAHFKHYMKSRGHKGTINIDWDAQVLEFDVDLNRDKAKSSTDERPSKKSKKGSGNDTKTFSGGERAYMTVAFLLALGEAMECPFRAMDEFDCFMDAANRNVSIKQLIEFSKNQGHRQFIYLTPLSLTKAIKDHKGDPMVGLWELDQRGAREM